MTMDDLYARLVVESLLARKQLAQTFESAATSEFSPVNDLTLGTALQKNAGKDETSIRDRVRSNKSFVHRTIEQAAGHLRSSLARRKATSIMQRILIIEDEPRCFAI
jgi:hypothetical protein